MKISDFRLAEYFLRKRCATKQVGFVDLDIEFTAEGQSRLHNGRLVIGNTDSFGKTIFNIVATYANNIDTICSVKTNSDDFQSFLNSVLSIIRDMTYGNGKKIHRDGQSELNKQPLVFVLMRDIVCPSFNRAINNVRIKTLKSPYIDAAKWVTKDSVAASDYSDFPVLMVNTDVENESYRQAFLFVETIKAHGLVPLDVVNDIYTKEEIRQPFMGLLKLSLGDTDDVNNFLTIVSAVTQYGGKPILDKSAWSISPVKTSQWGGGGMGMSSPGQTWWYLGLIEKLLEPARGSDWSRYEDLQEQTHELWEKIEKEKTKRGLDPLPMELLLRVQSEDFKQNPHLTIQGLLADNRVW